MAADSKWGLWGGRTPGGWACFRMEAGEWGYIGTRKQAAAGAELFKREGAPWAYTPVLFDPAREPEGVVDRPTAAQAKALRIAAKGRHPACGFAPARESTMDALWRRGWYMFDVCDGVHAEVRITKAGRASLALAAR